MDFETPFNISIDNVTFNTYNINLGSDESILQIIPSDSCESYKDINFPLQYPMMRKVQFSNILIKNDYYYQDANILYSMKIMKNKRQSSLLLTNQNSLTTIQQINNEAVYQDTQLTIENITVANVSTTQEKSLLVTNSSGSLYVQDLSFYNSSVNVRNVFNLQNHIKANVSGVTIMNINYFYDNAAFVDCSFARVMTLSNLTFSQMLFVNSTQRGTFLIKIKKILIDEVEQQNSIISQVSLTQIVVSNNNYYGDCFVFFFDSYFQEDNQTQVEILKSIFDLNYFLTTGLGMVMKVRCNMKNPIYINDTLFQNQTRGSLLFEAGNKDRLDVPLRVIFERVVMNYTISYYRAVVTVRTNTKLYFYNFLAQQSINIKRGGFVLADYKESYVYCYNCTFYKIVGFNGGVFFVHYGSKIEIDRATFTDCVGVQNGLGSVETDGHFTIKNSVLNSTYALKTSVVGITDSIRFTSYFQNVTFISNRILEISEFQDKFLPAFYLPSFKRDVANIYKRIQVGEKYLTKVMRSNLVFDNCTFISEKRLIDVYLSQVTIKNSIIKDFVINQDEPSYISTTTALLNLENVTFNNGIGGDAIINVLRSENIRINNVTFKNINSSVLSLQLTHAIINLATFEYDGGAIRLINSNLTLNESRFLNNYAVKGGALCVQCSKSKFCEYNILRTFFDQNYALQAGGAVYFSNHAPYIDNSSSTFGLQNYAYYGSNVGSYPVGVRLIKMDETNHIASGQLYSGTFKVELIDVNQNRLNADSISLVLLYLLIFYSNIQLNSLDSRGMVTGKKQVQVLNGVATFANLIFSASPGSKNVIYQFFSPNINNEQLYTILPQIPQEQINNLTISLNFRQCLSGEIVYNQECIICEIGTFSLTSGSTLCNECLSNAECFGGQQVSLKSGYWRSSYYSTQIHPCINYDSCIGGIIHDDTQSSNLLCKAGYGGNLCEKCVKYNGIQYTKLTSKECGQCPEMIFSLFTMIALLLVLVLILSILIFINLRSTQESETSVMLRIMTNYVQIMTTAAAFDLSYPKAFEDYLNMFTIFGESFEDSGEYWLKNQLEIQCWNGQHLQWALTIGFPAILVWVLLAPLIIININFYGVWLLGITNQSKSRFIVMLNVILRRIMYPIMRFELIDNQTSIRSFTNKSSFNHTYLQKTKDASNTFDLSQNEDLQNGKIPMNDSNYSVSGNQRLIRSKSQFSRMKSFTKKKVQIVNSQTQKLDQIMPSSQSNAMTFYNPQQTDNNQQLLLVSGPPNNSNKLASLRKQEKKDIKKISSKNKSRAVGLDKNGYDKTNDIVFEEAFGESANKSSQNQNHNLENYTHRIAPKVQLFNQDQTLDILNINYADESKDKVYKFEKIPEYQFFPKQNVPKPKTNSRNKKGVEISRKGEKREILKEERKSRFDKFEKMDRKNQSQSPSRQNKSTINQNDGQISNRSNKMVPISKEIISRAFYHSTYKRDQKQN
eukprot:403373983